VLAKRIPDVISHEAPASALQVDRLERVLGIKVPREYRNLLMEANGVLANIVTIYPAEIVPERNETHEVAKYMPGYFIIGDMGFPLLLRAGEAKSPIFKSAWGALDAVRELAPSLEAWIKQGCLDGEPDDPEYPDEVDIYLLRAPVNGIQGLRRILIALDMNIPVSELRAMIQRAPCRLVRAARYFPYVLNAHRVNQVEQCLGWYMVDNSVAPISLRPHSWL
jgi:hypothetical protein